MSTYLFLCVCLYASEGGGKSRDRLGLGRIQQYTGG